mmetsp:Transcript_129917/g.259171  ORF Transcript_129917/g.259171 Transcript_129917/m.259171 type:complete len:102 (-) Transcript_129917:1-306(-)
MAFLEHGLHWLGVVQLGVHCGISFLVLDLAPSTKYRAGYDRLNIGALDSCWRSSLPVPALRLSGSEQLSTSNHCKVRWAMSTLPCRFSDLASASSVELKVL